MRTSVCCTYTHALSSQQLLYRLAQYLSLEHYCAQRLGSAVHTHGQTYTLCVVCMCVLCAMVCMRVCVCVCCRATGRLPYSQLPSQPSRLHLLSRKYQVRVRTYVHRKLYTLLYIHTYMYSVDLASWVALIHAGVLLGGALKDAPPLKSSNSPSGD